MPTAPLTSSVSTASISTAILVPAAGPFAVVVSLEAASAAAAEPGLPVVEALFRGRASLAALLIVLLQQLFGLVSLQLSERHRLQEVASLRDSKVGLESDRGDHRRRRRRERQPIQQEMDGETERERQREKERGRGVVVKTRAATPPENKIKNYYYHTEAVKKNQRN